MKVPFMLRGVCHAPMSVRRRRTTPAGGYFSDARRLLRVSVLVANDQDTNTSVYGAVDDRVGKAVKRKPATVVAGGDAKTWVLHQKSGDAFKLLDEPRCYPAPSFVPVEPGRVTEVALRTSVERKAHSSSARNLAMASGPETGEDAPLSSSASRIAASRSQASSRVLSASRLATTRSSKRARSTGGKRRTSASRASIGSDMAETLCGRWAGPVACHKVAQRAPKFHVFRQAHPKSSWLGSQTSPAAKMQTKMALQS